MPNPVLIVTRHDNGRATFSYDGDPTDGIAPITREGFWDDATPWAAKSYTLDFAVKSNTRLPSFRLENVAERSGILIHDGQDERWSQGCLVVDQSFIDQIYADLGTRGMLGGKVAPIDFTVVGDADLKLSIETSTAVVSEGQNISITVSLSGLGASNGISKDYLVKIAVAGGTAMEGVDFAKLAGVAGMETINGDPGWLRIPKGTTSRTITIPVIGDNVDTDTEKPSESVSFRIADYQIVNDFSKDQLYADDHLIFRDSAKALANVTITNVENLINQSIRASGGVEGYSRIVQFSPGQALTIHFDPLTIPDRFSIAELFGSTLVDTGFIGGRTFDQTIVVPADGDGQLVIRVDTNDPQTQWNFTISNPFVRALAGAIALSVTPPTAAAEGEAMAPTFSAPVTAPLHTIRNLPEVAEGATQGVGPAVSLFLDDPSFAGKTIAWSIISTRGAVDAADFPSGAQLSGTFMVAANARLGDEVAYIELDTPRDDGVAEGRETFQIQFTDQATGKLITGSDGRPVVAEFSIVDGYVIEPLRLGTAGGDTLTGSANGLNGADLLTGTAGNDALDAGAGNDTVSGLDGDDAITPGFGDDSIDGGAGIDTLLLPTRRALVDVIANPDGSYTLVDRSPAPLGTDHIVGVERIQFADGLLDLTNQAPTDIALDKPTVTENAAAGTVVGRLLVTDPDVGDTQTLVLLNDAGGRFVLSGDAVQVASGARIDFEETPNLTIQVQTTDSKGHVFTKALTIGVQDVAESFVGGAGADTIRGDAGANNVQGLAGGDILNGGSGNDTLSGGEGADVFVASTGQDRITDFFGSYAAGQPVRLLWLDVPVQRPADRIDISALHMTFADVQAHSVQVGDDVRWDIAPGSSLLLEHTLLANLRAADFIV